MGIITSIYNWYYLDEKAVYSIIRTKCGDVGKIVQTVSVNVNGEKSTYCKITTINKDGRRTVDETGDMDLKYHSITGDAIY